MQVGVNAAWLPTALVASQAGPRNNYDFSDAFAAMPEFLRQLICATVREVDVDPVMALSTRLAGMFAGVQGSVVARRPDSGTEQLSGFFIMLGEPTTGKSRTHRNVHEPHNAEDIRRYIAYRKAASDIAATKKKESPRRAASRGGNTNPRLRSAILQDANYRGLLEALEGVGEAAYISVHEGQTVLHSSLFRHHLDVLSVLWDGDDKVMLTRARGDIVMAFKATLSVLVMAQPSVFEAYRGKFGDYARGSGFFARCLFAYVPAIRTPLDLSVAVPDDCLDRHNATVAEFLAVQLGKLEAGDTERTEVGFSTEACHLYGRLMAEHQRRSAQRFWSIPDAANRAAQYVIRLAVVIHCYSGESGDVPVGTLYAAFAIAQFYLGQFAEIFPPKPLIAPPPPKPTAYERHLQRHAQRLYDDRYYILRTISELCRHNREPSALKFEVMTVFREHAYDARFRAALFRLTKGGEVLEEGEGKNTRLSIVPQQFMAAANPTFQSSASV